MFHGFPDIEFVTRVTSLARVRCFWARVNFSRIKAKNYPFLCNLPIKGSIQKKYGKKGKLINCVKTFE